MTNKVSSDRKKEKTKWQTAFRRFIVESSPSEQYARYFGLDRNSLRKWIESQFTPDQNWENFGVAWQFEHVIAVSWFDPSSEKELKKCWNYLNIRVAAMENSFNSTDLLFAKSYFEELYKRSGLSGCLEYVQKIDSILLLNPPSPTSLQVEFIKKHQKELEAIRSFSEEEYAQYLESGSVQEILTEREILKKFG